MSVRGTGETIRLFARFVERSLGLHFPDERFGELESKLAPLCRQAGFAELRKYLLWLMAAPLSPGQLATLASALTIGETYFLRDPNSFRALEERLLPELVAARRAEGRTLRIWSAGCASGEEPYTIAILLSRAIPDLDQWRLSLLGTDLNPQALERARRGVYSQWSFRNAPDWLMDYFTLRSDRRYQISSRIREMVSFSQLNLAEPGAVAGLTAAGRMDIIFCRNVMLYFDPRRIASTMAAFHEALAEGGWLFVGATELNYAKVPGFCCRQVGGALLLQKLAAGEAQAAAQGPKGTPAPRRLSAALSRGAAGAGYPAGAGLPAAGGGAPAGPAAGRPARGAASAGTAKASHPAGNDGREGAAAGAGPADWGEEHAEALRLYRAGRYQDAAERGERAAVAGPAARRADSLLLAARAYANLGSLQPARECCERALACERLLAPGHYLLSVILEQQGELEGAARSLKNALFIDHDYLLAYFALGNLHRLKGEWQEAERQFATALTISERRPADQVIEDAEGLTAGGLAQLIRAMLKAGAGNGRGKGGR
ncbi:MAG TPA: CheR family methyltransferase [Geomonas sp.]|nr:CheR family methyltransferase [Geomonas sp.]